jgi:hypothetical protein
MDKLKINKWKWKMKKAASVCDGDCHGGNIFNIIINEWVTNCVHLVGWLF